MSWRTETLVVSLAAREDGTRWHTFHDLLCEQGTVDYDEEPLSDDPSFQLLAMPVAVDGRLVLPMLVRFEDSEPHPTEWSWPGWARLVECTAIGETGEQVAA